jgi:hypothetical protein
MMRDRFSSTVVLFMWPKVATRLFGFEIDPGFISPGHPFELNAAAGVIRTVENLEPDFVLVVTPAGYHGVFVAPAELTEVDGEVYRSLRTTIDPLSSADALVVARAVTRTLSRQ